MGPDRILKAFGKASAGRKVGKKKVVSYKQHQGRKYYQGYRYEDIFNSSHGESTENSFVSDSSDMSTDFIWGESPSSPHWRTVNILEKFCKVGLEGLSYRQSVTILTVK
jgi:hypothetical protein